MILKMNITNPHINVNRKEKKPFEVETNILPVPKNLTNSDNISNKKIAFPKKGYSNPYITIRLSLK